MGVWRAVDGEGETLDLAARQRRDTTSALRLLRRLLQKQGQPEAEARDWCPFSARSSLSDKAGEWLPLPPFGRSFRDSGAEKRTAWVGGDLCQVRL